MGKYKPGAEWTGCRATCFAPGPLWRGNRLGPKKRTPPPPPPPPNVNELARDKGVEAMQQLIKIAKNPKAEPGARIMAANAILDRAYGKPKAYVETKNDDRFKDMSDKELRQYLVSKVGGLAGDR